MHLPTTRLLIFTSLIVGSATALAMHSSADPLDFSPPAHIRDDGETDTDDDLCPAVGLTATGLAAWRSYENESGDTDLLMARSTDGGASWTPPFRLWGSPGPDGHEDVGRQHLATDGAATWVVAWFSRQETPPTSPQLFVSRSVNDGRDWSTPQLIGDDAGGWDSDVRLATDGAGTWIAVWDSSNDLDGTIGSDLDILFARSEDDAQTWTAPAPINTDAATDQVAWDGSDTDARPTIATDGNGNWIVAWIQHGPPSPGFPLLVSRSVNDGRDWSDPLDVFATVGAYLYPGLASDGCGSWLLGWGTWMNTSGDVIVASRSTDAGATWTDPSTIDAVWPIPHFVGTTLATDRRGNWVAAWTEVGADDELRAAHSADTGETWTDSLLLDTSATCVPQVATDGTGRWLAVWNARTGSDFDVFASSAALPPIWPHECNVPPSGTGGGGGGGLAADCFLREEVARFDEVEEHDVTKAPKLDPCNLRELLHLKRVRGVPAPMPWRSRHHSCANCYAADAFEAWRQAARGAEGTPVREAAGRRLTDLLRDVPAGPRFTEEVRAETLRELPNLRRGPIPLFMLAALNALALDDWVPQLERRKVQAGSTRRIEFPQIAKLTFDRVKRSGEVSLTIDSGWPAIPPGYAAGFPAAVYRFEFTGELAPKSSVEIELYAAETAFPRRPGTTRLFEWDGRTFRNITTDVDLQKGWVRGHSRSLRTYVLGQPEPPRPPPPPRSWWSRLFGRRLER
jgi:hypothetical protein